MKTSVEGECVIGFSFCDELLCFNSCVVEGAGLEVVPDVVFGVDVSCCRGGAGDCCSSSYWGRVSNVRFWW